MELAIACSRKSNGLSDYEKKPLLMQDDYFRLVKYLEYAGLKEEAEIEKSRIYQRHPEFLDKLAVVREQQKAMIKNNSAAYFPTNFTYNNSLSQGKKLIADNVKQILRAFNNECEAIIDKVKFNNAEAIRKRIIKSCEDLNKLNSKMQISIAPAYLDLKLQEMNLCYEYAMKKQEENKIYLERGPIKDLELVSATK